MILLTAATKEYAPLADLGEPDKVAWCKRWGAEYRRVFYATPPTCWSRPQLWLDTLQECDWLFWQGADTLMTNLTINPERYTGYGYDFLFSCDGNGLQSDVWFMRRCPATVTFLQWVLEHGDGVGNNEQDALSVYLSGAPDYPSFCDRIGPLSQGGSPPSEETLGRLHANLSRSPVRVGIVPQRLLNAYPHTEYGGTGLEPHSWQPGDFLLHMPGRALEHRLRVWPKFLATVVR